MGETSDEVKKEIGQEIGKEIGGEIAKCIGKEGTGDKSSKVKCTGGAAAGGSAGFTLWIIGWMFSISFISLTFWEAVLGLLIWPYYLGIALG